jgi:hypothetical protein
METVIQYPPNARNIRSQMAWLERDADEYRPQGYYNCYVNGELAGCADTPADAWRYIDEYIYWVYVYPTLDHRD